MCFSLCVYAPMVSMEPWAAHYQSQRSVDDGMILSLDSKAVHVGSLWQYGIPPIRMPAMPQHFVFGTPLEGPYSPPIAPGLQAPVHVHGGMNFGAVYPIQQPHLLPVKLNVHPPSASLLLHLDRLQRVELESASPGGQCVGSTPTLATYL
ncbi:hypothetical protein R1sor_006298 [Riccia sorocarpa]|uniref:Uncharacterized protein n=1 Tax=Riccia sorocarpa TaxID=122646 RepID=A0ABD3HQ07_9MARC